jgi:arylformamidase
MIWIDLSHTITTHMPQWRGDEQPLVIHRRSEHGPGTHRASSLEMGCHVGTHIDAPSHFLAGAKGVDEMPLQRFVGPALVLHLADGAGACMAPGPLPASVLEEHDLTEVDFVLFHTGWDRFWGEPSYYQEWPYLSEELAENLVAAGLKGVGLDTPSLDVYNGHRAHDMFAAAGLINIENLCGLERAPARGGELLVLPLKLHDTEASPVRAVMRVEARDRP